MNVHFALLIAQTDYAAKVNPFIGTGGHGHTFPGATLPFGMVQLSPDTRIDGSWDGCSGYHYSDSAIYGFSHTHLSGTGVSDYGDIAILPVVDLPKKVYENKEIDYRNYKLFFNHANEKAEAGYYSVKTNNGIQCELTATTRVGFHKYTFPKEGAHAIIIQLDHRDETTESSITSTSPNELVIHRKSTAWARNQSVFSYITFSQKISDIKIVKNEKGKNHCKYAIVSFAKLKSKPLYIKVGLSTVNIGGAVSNLRAELNHWDFEKVKKQAQESWNKELSKIEVTGGSADEQTIFYTSLYHTMIHPNIAMDVDGSYRGMDDKIHKAEGFTYYTVFSLWDTFRATHPLYTIIDKKRTLDFIKTFLTHYKEGGRLPVWELASNETGCMIGYHSVSVLLDAYVKGIQDFDQSLALEAMTKSATWNHLGLPQYMDHGFLSIDDEHESVSKTLEYAYDDWCIFKFAQLIGRKDEATVFLKRAQSWKNVFDSKTGFMRSRKNGAWLSPFDPAEVNNNYTEANAWQYSFFVPQDVIGLIQAMGGADKFEKKLDDLFSASIKTTGREQADITGLIGQYAHGNEPSHHMAYLYNFVARPWKSQNVIKKIQREFYKNDPDGLIGNEDCGQMSAWYVLSSMGFYQVSPGIPFYSVGFPVFSSSTIHLENGRKFIIKSENYHPDAVVYQVNELDNFTFSHADIVAGNTITLKMTNEPIRVSKGTDQSNDAFLAWYSTSDYITVPVFEAKSQTFYDSLSIEMISNYPQTEIRFTRDGSLPNRKSELYTKPFFIHSTSTIKAIAFTTHLESYVNTAFYHKIPNRYTIDIKSKYNPQYNAGGPSGIIDGLKADLNWRKGGWQGYQSQDFEAIIDMKEVKSIQSVSASFLQDTRSWIIFPSEVQYFTSMDGINFIPASEVIKNRHNADNYDILIDTYTFGFLQPHQCRYIKIKAKNFGALPQWHQGYGGDAFIFIDEIEIR